MNKTVPPSPIFTDDVTEEPISGENLDAMIANQMKERESIFNSTETNQIISNQPFENSIPIPIQQNNLEEKINKIEKMIQFQSILLEKITQSQIAILNKIK